jgi:predicted methyltransferase
MSLRAISIALLLGASPAMAFDTSKLGQGGSLPLSDIMPLISKTAQLQSEVNKALAEAKKKPDDLMCDGMRFPGQWVHLAGERVSPYTCDFGAKWLQIDATVRITDRNGRRVETITPKAMKNATKVSETNLRWKWTTEDPSKNN